MAIIDDIKCPRCDRKYSGVRSRCPYCGARRIGLGKYAKDSSNAKGKMMISVLILAVFTVAAGIMLLTSPSNNTPEPVEEEPAFNPIEDSNLSLASELPTPEPTPIPTPEPPPEVRSAQIWVPRSHRVVDFTISISKNGPIDLTAVLEPPSAEAVVTWSYEGPEDDPIFEYEEITGGVRVIPLRAGGAQIVLSVGDITEKCWVRVND